MKKIFPGDDFTLKFPDYLSGKTMPDGTTVSVKIFTINRTESYSLVVSDNPFPASIELSSDVLMYMTSGAVQVILTINLPDSEMPDSYYNSSRLMTTDLFWINKNSGGQSLEELNNKINALDSSVHSNYYNKRETDNLLDLLWSDVAGTYVDDTEMAIAVDSLDSSVKTNYYDKTTVDNLINDVSVDLSDYYTKSQTYSRSVIDTKDAEERNYVNTNFYNRTEISNNYYNKASIDGLVSDLDSSVKTNFYDKTTVDGLLSNITVDSSGLVDSSSWDETNQAIAVELMNQKIKDLELESSFDNYITKVQADNKFIKNSAITNFLVTDSENRMKAIAGALSALDTSIGNIQPILDSIIND